MAITPEECVAPTKDERNLIVDLEKEIDSFLLNNFVSITQWIRFPLKEKISQRVFTAIKALYVESGWQVSEASYEDDHDVAGIYINRGYALDFIAQVSDKRNKKYSL